jgi:hypothetical protein
MAKASAFKDSFVFRGREREKRVRKEEKKEQRNGGRERGICRGR